MLEKKRRVLITGAGGLIGWNLAEYLLDQGMDVTGISRSADRMALLAPKGLNMMQGSVDDAAFVAEGIRCCRPDYLFHCGAQSLPRIAWEEPEQTLTTNILGTLHVLQGVLKAGIDPVIQIAGSSSEYAFTDTADPIAENFPLEPCNPYGVSKLAAESLALTYAKVKKMRIHSVRPFFVIGPWPKRDVCNDFAGGIARIEAGLQDSLRLGNMKVVRDFLDVRDAVRALWLLMERGEVGEAYNVCSGQGWPIEEILNILKSRAGREIPAQHDPSLLRPVDEPVKIGDNTKLKALGWKPEIQIQDTLNDILDYWRASVQNELKARSQQ